MEQPRAEIRNVAELEAVLGVPERHVATKVRPSLHQVDRRWIAASQLCMVGTSDGQGNCDVSPKGDPVGGFITPDNHTVVIPERPGNRRTDGYHNILQNPHVGLLFVILGRRDSLRVNGAATLVRDAPYFESLEYRGHRPKVCLEIAVEEVFYHCGKAFIRSGAWKPETWTPDAVPRRAVIAKVVESRSGSIEELDTYYGPSYDDRSYIETAPRAE